MKNILLNIVFRRYCESDIFDTIIKSVPSSYDIIYKTIAILALESLKSLLKVKRYLTLMLAVEILQKVTMKGTYV